MNDSTEDEEWLDAEGNPIIGTGGFRGFLESIQSETRVNT